MKLSLPFIQLVDACSVWFMRMPQPAWHAVWGHAH